MNKWKLYKIFKDNPEATTFLKAFSSEWAKAHWRRYNCGFRVDDWVPFQETVLQMNKAGIKSDQIPDFVRTCYADGDVSDALIGHANRHDIFELAKSDVFDLVKRRYLGTPKKSKSSTKSKKSVPKKKPSIKKKSSTKTSTKTSIKKKSSIKSKKSTKTSIKKSTKKKPSRQLEIIRIGYRQKQILDCFENGEILTSGEISRRTNISRAYVCPLVADLRKSNLLRCHKHQGHQKTKKKVLFDIEGRRYQRGRRFDDATSRETEVLEFMHRSDDKIHSPSGIGHGLAGVATNTLYSVLCNMLFKKLVKRIRTGRYKLHPRVKFDENGNYIPPGKKPKRSKNRVKSKRPIHPESQQVPLTSTELEAGIALALNERWMSVRQIADNLDMSEISMNSLRESLRYMNRQRYLKFSDNIAGDYSYRYKYIPGSNREIESELADIRMLNAQISKFKHKHQPPHKPEPVTTFVGIGTPPIDEELSSDISFGM